MRLLLDNVENTQKPIENIGQISNRLYKLETDVDIQELAEALVKGRTFAPATFNGLSRKNQNWKQQQVFCLDFDNGFTPDEALTRLKELRLQHSFFYLTFSDDIQLRKFRIVFHLENSITDKKYRDFIQEVLMKIFPESDKACKDASRLFFGGRQLLSEEYKPLELDVLTELARVYTVVNTDRRLYNRELSKIIKNDANATAALYNKEPVKNASRLAKSPEESDIEELRDVDLEKLVSQIAILADFVAGSADGCWQDGYQKLKGIITNMMYIRGGLKWVKKVMDAHGYFLKHHYALLYTLKKYKYKPMNLVNFSPFLRDYKYTNILTATGKGQYGFIRLDEPYEVYTLQYAEKLLSQSFVTALNNRTDRVTVIKTATGLGKTMLLESLPNGSYTIAVPTHALKRELYQRITSNKKNKISYLVTPELPTSLPSEIREHLDYLYQVGANEAATGLLSAFKQTLQESDSLRIELEKFAEDNAAAYGCSQEHSILTTHHKALSYTEDEQGNIVHNFSSTKTLIVDEDIIPSLLKTGSVTREDLHRLKDALPSDFTCIALLERFINEISGAPIVNETPQTFLTEEELGVILSEMTQNHRKYSSNILEFLSSSFYARSFDKGDEGKLYYVVQNPLPNKRIIIFSATADETMYRSIFKERLEFIDISNVQIKGSINLDSTYSCSKSSLNGENARAYINSQIEDDRITITFNSYKPNIKNSDEKTHFWNSSGYDHLKGKDLAIVGCPHSKPVVYALYAKCFGARIRPHDLMMTTKRIRRNGFEFNFKTFINEQLQAIQLYCIEAELIQAIGRARVVRTDADVKVFSGFPVRDHKGNVVLVDAQKQTVYFLVGEEELVA